MCGIVGVVRSSACERHNNITQDIYNLLNHNCHRGYDGWGCMTKERTSNKNIPSVHKRIVGGPQGAKEAFEYLKASEMFICNFRAQPLPELPSTSVNHIHPFCIKNRVYIVHNGTISNDKEICAKYGFPAVEVDTEVIAYLYHHMIRACNNNIEEAVKRTCSELEGGFAFFMYDQVLDRLIVAKNYKTLHMKYIQGEVVSFASEIPDSCKFSYVMFPPHTACVINPKNINIESTFSITSSYASKYIPIVDNQKCISVCSGGLDSSLSAFIMSKMLGYNTTVVNFNLGQRGWESEQDASSIVAKKLGAGYIHLDLREFFKHEVATPLTSYDLEVTLGEKSAEAGTEWVPARNLQLIAVATGLAESIGAKYLVAGTNLEEECSCYSDNDYSFIKSLSLAMQHGTLQGIQMRPVVNRLMKRDIVTLGTALGVPFESTMSCYDPVPLDKLPPEKRKLAKAAGLHHAPCGICGCCETRVHAFLAARIRDPQTDMYANDPKAYAFKTYDYYMNEIQKNGYIDTSDPKWAEGIIKQYMTRVNI